jgi:hypothetical protein
MSKMIRPGRAGSHFSQIYANTSEQRRAAQQPIVMHHVNRVSRLLGNRIRTSGNRIERYKSYGKSIFVSIVILVCRCEPPVIAGEFPAKTFTTGSFLCVRTGVIHFAKLVQSQCSKIFEYVRMKTIGS